MKVITAFDSFKNCICAKDACEASKKAILELHPDAEVVSIPMSDGGEGMVDSIFNSVDADMVTVTVNDPVGRSITANYAISADGTTAYMEIASACGLHLVEEQYRNPMITTTMGVGDMLINAIQRGCKRVVMGLGGSATCDAGEGMLTVLKPYLPIDLEIIAACDVTNPLYGKNGAAYVFAPQKGATPSDVKALDKRLRRFAQHAEENGIASPQLALHPGAGAAGGLGYALMAFLHATLTSGVDLILDTIDFDNKIKDADLIITGEGKSDKQTLMGKVAFGILSRAKKNNIPVKILSGAVEDKDLLLNAGFADVVSINEGDTRPLSELLKKDVAISNISSTTKGII